MSGSSSPQSPHKMPPDPFWIWLAFPATLMLAVLYVFVFFGRNEAVTTRMPDPGMERGTAGSGTTTGQSRSPN